MEAQSNLYQEKEEFEDEEFKEYLAEKLHGKKPEMDIKLPDIDEEPIKVKPKRERDQHNLYDMIKAAKELLQNKELAKAKEIYSEVEKTYRTTKFTPQNKKQIYYDILELKTDIDLAAL